MSDAMRVIDSASLLNTLAAGLELYRRSDVAERRKGALHQLAVLIDLAGQCIDDARVLEPIRHLHLAVSGLDRGERDDLLKPGPVGHRPKLAARETGVRAKAAVAMQLLMDAGKSKLDASAEVSRKLGAVRPDRIADWREQATSGGRELIAVRYRALLLDLRSLFPKDPGRAAAHLIGRMTSKNLG